MRKMECDLWKIIPDNWPLAVQIAEAGLNSPLTSSAGRLFDAAAAILGIRGKINYEGQAAVELEQVAASGQGKILPYKIQQRQGMRSINFLPMFKNLIENSDTLADKAASFHLTIAAAVVQIAQLLSRQTGVKKIVLSGGVFQNLILLKNVLTMLEGGFSVYINRKVPVNDGGLAFGQAAVACALINEK